MNQQKIFHDELNFRDLGGYITRDHRTIRKGLFYRSSNLSWMNPYERKEFQKLGIRNILDLRTSEESARDPDPVFPGIVNVRHSGVVSKGGEEIDFSPKGMSQIGENGRKQYEMLMKYYEDMPFDNEALHVLVDLVVRGKLPVCFHCATGKDRTGVAAMVLLMLLNADEKVILQDYLRSNSYRKKVIYQMFRDNKKQTEDEYGKKLLMMRAGVLAETGENVLKKILERCGSYDRYLLQEFHLDADTLTWIRNEYTF